MRKVDIGGVDSTTSLLNFIDFKFNLRRAKVRGEKVRSEEKNGRSQKSEFE